MENLEEILAKELGNKEVKAKWEAMKAPYVKKK